MSVKKRDRKRRASQTRFTYVSAGSFEFLKMSRIPKVLHYTFGMAPDFGGKPWSLVHHVCLKSAIERLRPDNVFFYYEFEPTGPWWKLSRPLVTMVPIKAPRAIFGRPLVHFAHRSDVVRLQKLIEHGGIYLDADVLVQRDFDELLGHSAVLGQEGEWGLANAVILAEPQSAFLRRWLDQYKSFRSRGQDEFWAEHGVTLPLKLARDYPDEITVLSHQAFYWPLWTDSHLKWIFASTQEIPVGGSYANHLWQSCSWRYLEDLTPGRVRSVDTNFHRWVEPLIVGLPDDYGAPIRQYGTSGDRKPRGRNQLITLGRGPVWRGSSVPIRRRRSVLGIAVDKLLRKEVQQVETDEPGKAIWDLCDGVRTIDEITIVLQAQFYSKGDEIRADVMHALQVLADAGLVTSSDDSANITTQLIDLRDIPILVINGEDRPDRREFMQRQMESLELKFSFANSVKHASRVIGCAEAHLNILNRPDLRTPFMILEDDCEFTDRLHYRYALPQEADALYLGVSGFGVAPAGTFGDAVWKGVRFTRYGPNYLRVLSMLSSHAKIYLNEEYRRAVKEKASIWCRREEHIDVILASLQLSHLVLTPNEPVCHQSETLGGQYEATRQSLLELADR